MNPADKHDIPVRDLLRLENDMLCDEELEEYSYGQSQSKTIKKNPKNKKKKKALEKQAEIERELQVIVEGIYWNHETYQTLQDQINIVISKASNSQIFQKILDQSIKEYIEYLKDDIWDCMEREIWKEQFLDAYSYSTSIPEYPEFYVCLILQLHKKYEIFEKASLELQKILNTYNKRYQTIYQQDIPGDLCKRTFELFIEEDQFFKKFIRCCQRMLPLFQKSSSNTDVLNKLMEILKVVRLIRADSETYNKNQEEEDDDMSTVIDSEDFDFGTQKKKKKRKNKNKNKKKQNEVANTEVVQICEIDEVDLERLIQMLGNGGDGDKLKIEVSEEWLDELRRARNRT